MSAKSTAKKILLFTFATLTITAISLWNRGLIQKWIRARIVTFYVQKVQPNLPFVIEEAEFDAGWRDLWNGKLSRLSMNIRRDDWVVTIEGPIDIRQNAAQKIVTIAYRTQARVQFKKESSTPFELELNAQVTSHLRALNKVSVVATSPEFKWRDVKISEPQIHVESADLQDFSVQSAAAAIYVENPELMAKIPGFTLQIAGNLKNQISGEIHAQDGELLKGSDYYSLPLSEFPFSFSIAGPQDPRRLEIKSGKTAKFQLLWENRLLTARGQIPAIAPFIAIAESSLNKKLIPETILAKGGKLSFDVQAKTPPLKEISADALVPLPASRLSLDKLALRDRAGAWVIPRISFKASPTQIRLESLPLQVRQWKTTFVPLTIDFKFSPVATDVRVNPTDGSRISLIQNSTLPLTLTKLQGAYDRESKELGLTTSVALAKTAWQDIRKNFCLGALKDFPAQIEFQFNPVHIFNDNIDPTGSARLSVFEGFAELSDFGVYNFTSAVPEFDFDLRVDQIRMDQIDAWIGFGEMDGYFQAQVDDAVFQGWLPTQYNAWAQIKPHHHKQVVFSAEAMRNLVKLFASDAIDKIPAIAQWFAFGWPSAVFGGYNIQYAGLKLSSKDAQIKLETLDPPEVIAKENQHFFLYGPRFKMPLRSFHYPLIVDATAMGNFLRQITLTMKEIVRNKKSDKSNPLSEERDNKENNNDENEFGPCLVPEI